MKVRFFKTWFGPGGRRFRPGIHDVPNEMVEAIPASAEIVDGEAPDDAGEDDGLSLRDFDNERAATDAEGAVIERAQRKPRQFKRAPKAPAAAQE